MSKSHYYKDEELDSLIDRDAEILASVARIEEIQAAGDELDVYYDIVQRMITAGGCDDHSGASFFCVRYEAYQILKGARL